MKNAKLVILFTLVSLTGSVIAKVENAGSIVSWGAVAFDSKELDANDFIAISAGWNYSLALKSDGSLIGWGRNWYGQATPPDGNDYVAIAAGTTYSLALKSNGSVVGWWYDYGILPVGNDFIAISAGNGHNLALKSNGSIIGWGDNYYGQAAPPDGNDFVAISTGD